MTIVIMAAGLGSRFGGIKQMESVDTYGHTLIDYAVYDAIRAGFHRVVFVIKKSIEDDFKSLVLSRIENMEIETDCVYQELDSLPYGFSTPAGRKKPWGTAHAVCALRGKIDTPFALINADDFYGAEAYIKMAGFLAKGNGENAMVGYRLKNTLSENGGVSRGICRVESGHLSGISEVAGIREREGVIISAGGARLDPDATVSMNFWGFTPEIIDECERGFIHFISQESNACSLGEECYLTDVISNALKEKRMKIRVLKNESKWCGITYREDKEGIVKRLDELVMQGVYPKFP